VEKIVLKINDMSCEHCVKTITKAVNVLPGVFTVIVDLKTKTVTAEYNPTLITAETIKHKIEEQGYNTYT